MRSRRILLTAAIAFAFTGTAFADVAFPVGFKIAAYAVPAALIALCAWIKAAVIRKTGKK